MDKKDIWHFEIKYATWFLLVISIGVNYAGKFFSALFHLPIWLDSMGTIFAGLLLGPAGGLIVGFGTNYSYGYIDHVSYLYIATSVAIGVVTGILSRAGFINWYKIPVLIAILAVLSAAVSVPINLIIADGHTGLVFWDKLFHFLLYNQVNLSTAAFFSEVSADFFDKIVVVLIAYTIYKRLPTPIIERYK